MELGDGRRAGLLLLNNFIFQYDCAVKSGSKIFRIPPDTDFRMYYRHADAAPSHQKRPPGSFLSCCAVFLF